MAYFNPYQPMGYGSPYGYPSGGPQSGAEAFRMAPNSSILLMDEHDPIVWLKTTDGAGYATVTPYSVAPYQPAPVVDVNSLEDRVKRLEEMLSGKPDDADAKRRQKPTE